MAIFSVRLNGAGTVSESECSLTQKGESIRAGWTSKDSDRTWTGAWTGYHALVCEQIQRDHESLFQQDCIRGIHCWGSNQGCDLSHSDNSADSRFARVCAVIAGTFGANEDCGYSNDDRSLGFSFGRSRASGTSNGPSDGRHQWLIHQQMLAAAPPLAPLRLRAAQRANRKPSAVKSQPRFMTVRKSTRT